MAALKKLDKSESLNTWEGQDGRTRAPRLMKSHALELVSDIGGIDCLSHSEIQLCKRLAELTYIMDNEMYKNANEGNFDWSAYKEASSLFNRHYKDYTKLLDRYRAKKQNVVGGGSHFGQ